MREIAAQFEEAGVAVRFVVMAPPQEVARFCARFGEANRCVADPEKRTYEAMGLGRYNLLRLFTDPQLRERRAANRAAGFRQDWGATSLRNAARLPGAAFVDGSGTIRWLYRGAHPGDLPPMAQMLAAISERLPSIERRSDR